MRLYFLLAALLALASCAAQKALPQYTEQQKADQRAHVPFWQPSPDTGTHFHRTPMWTPADSILWAKHKQARTVDSVVVEPHRSLLDKVLRRKSDITRTNVRPVSVGKKSTVSVYYGAATVTTTVAGKKAQVAAGDGATVHGDTKAKGGSVVSQDSSVSNALTGGGNLAAVHGDGNQLDLTKQDTTKEAPGVLATIAKELTGPLGYLLALGLSIGAIYLFVLWRKKKAAETLV